MFKSLCIACEQRLGSSKDARWSVMLGLCRCMILSNKGRSRKCVSWREGRIILNFQEELEKFGNYFNGFVEFKINGYFKKIYKVLFDKSLIIKSQDDPSKIYSNLEFELKTQQRANLKLFETAVMFKFLRDVKIV